MEVALLIVSGLIIVLGLLQTTKQGDITGGLTTTSDMDLFSIKKDRGAEKVLINLTYAMGILFFGLVIVINTL